MTNNLDEQNAAVLKRTLFNLVRRRADDVRHEQRKLTTQKDEVVQKYSPYQVGDIITIPKESVFFIGRKGRVEDVGIKYDSSEKHYFFVVRGVVRLWNGNDSYDKFKFRQKVESL